MINKSRDESRDESVTFTGLANDSKDAEFEVQVYGGPDRINSVGVLAVRLRKILNLLNSDLSPRKKNTIRFQP